MVYARQALEKFDKEMAMAISSELQRQELYMNLIASENYASPNVISALGSVLNNKYAEGYPSRRYYSGCEYVDIAENLAIERAKKLFKADYANVQPHSGSQANFAVYLALLKPGDTILGMSLDHGGHLTHGSKVNFSGKFFNSIQYGLDPHTEEIDYPEIYKLAQKHKPKLIMAGFSAYSRIVDWDIFREIADSISAWLVIDMAHVAGLVAADLYPSPVNIADVTTCTTHKTLRGPRGGLILAKKNEELARKLDSAIFPGSQGGPLMNVIAGKAIAFKEALFSDFRRYQNQVVANAKCFAKAMQNRDHKIVSGGTDNHMFLVDLIDKGYTGKSADAALGMSRISVNRNTVPNDPRPPFITSGLRIGTPAISTRGLKTPQIERLANLVCNVLEDINDLKVIEATKEEITQLCIDFPIYDRVYDSEYT